MEYIVVFVVGYGLGSVLSYLFHDKEQKIASRFEPRIKQLEADVAKVKQNFKL